MTTAADYPGDRNLNLPVVRGDLSGAVPAFSMRTLMVATDDSMADEAPGLSPGAAVQGGAAVAGICSVCGVDREQYVAWQQRRDQAREVFEHLSRREQEIAGLAGLIRIFLEADLPVPPGALIPENGTDDVG